MSDAKGISVLGIRHHGPGSARSVLNALEALAPDCVLVEGPPDADGILSLAQHADMQPPVALLVYVPDTPQLSAFFPFAEFSPEWQAIRFALGRQIPVRFMDLPQWHQLVQRQAELAAVAEALTEEGGAEDVPSEDDESPQANGAATEESPGADDEGLPIHHDPLNWLGQAAGYSDGEEWWEQVIEQRQDGADAFAAIQDAMTALRSEFPRPELGDEQLREQQREAYMRRSLRAAKKEGFERIAVVCGAWHSPAFSEKRTIKEDNELLRGLPKVKTQTTWVPWTYGRLATASGYGAGVASPGWYEHLWRHAHTRGARSHLDTTNDSGELAVGWLSRVAMLLRDAGLDASSAHVIEAVRLAEALAAMRDRPIPGLAEMNEATQTILCFGDDLPLRLVSDKLIVSERLGAVPADTPIVPLQRDLEKQQRSLRLKAEAFQKDVDLDLRKPNGLARSQLLHRLGLLNIPWGIVQQGGRGKGTFHEIWRLQWQPEFAVGIIEAARWGNTVTAAAAAFAKDRADHAKTLPELSELVDAVLLADLPDAVAYVMERLDSHAARSSDVVQLMDALPPLTQAMRYGTVRKTDVGMIEQITDGLVTRICIGLASAASSLDDDAAQRLHGKIVAVNSALGVLSNDAYWAAWTRSLTQLAGMTSIHGLVVGRCCRILFDSNEMDADALAQRMGLALSVGNEPDQAAAWVEGFLQGSGMVLLHDDQLWQTLDTWVAALPAAAFQVVLPLLRRTFSTFPEPERKQMGTRARKNHGDKPTRAGDHHINHERAQKVLPVLQSLLLGKG